MPSNYQSIIFYTLMTIKYTIIIFTRALNMIRVIVTINYQLYCECINNNTYFNIIFSNFSLTYRLKGFNKIFILILTRTHCCLFSIFSLFLIKVGSQFSFKIYFTKLSYYNHYVILM